MEIEELRNSIDRADSMLLTSFVTRMRVTTDIAKYKKENGLEVFDPEREKEKLEQIGNMAPQDLREECVKLYEKILEISKDYQERIMND